MFQRKSVYPQLVCFTENLQRPFWIPNPLEALSFALKLDGEDGDGMVSQGRPRSHDSFEMRKLQWYSATGLGKCTSDLSDDQFRYV